MTKPDVVTVAATRADGGLTVSRFIISEENPVITTEVVNEVYGRRVIQIAEGKKPPGDAIVSWRFVPNDFVDENTDDTFRNAWKDDGNGKPDHDMPKAREIHRAHLRRARVAEFDRLDNDYRVADEAGDHQAKKDIGAVRQKFRDVTEDPRIEAAQTIDELKALRLEQLVPETKGEKSTDKLRVSPAIPDRNPK